MWSTSLERPLTMINTDYFRNEWRVHTVALVCLTSYLAELLALRQLIFFRSQQNENRKSEITVKKTSTFPLMITVLVMLSTRTKVKKTKLYFSRKKNCLPKMLASEGTELTNARMCVLCKIFGWCVDFTMELHFLRAKINWLLFVLSISFVFELDFWSRYLIIVGLVIGVCAANDFIIRIDFWINIIGWYRWWRRWQRDWCSAHSFSQFLQFIIVERFVCW